MRTRALAAALLLAGPLLGGSTCPGTTAGLVGPEGSAIGRICGDGMPREALAAQAIASAYRLTAVRDLQLVETPEPGVFIAVYRLGPEDARPQELFAATVLEEPHCMAVVAQGDACDPLAFSPIYLPRFADQALAVQPAEMGPWEAVDEPVIGVRLVAAATDPEPGFPEARAEGFCLFRLHALPDGRVAPAALFSWTMSAYTIERARQGNDFTTESATDVHATLGEAPRPLTAESVVVDVECTETEDRNALCIQQCIARTPAAGGTADLPDSATQCETECSAVEPEAGTWCAAVVDRVTEWLGGRKLDDGRIIFEPSGQEEARSRLDPDCILHGRPAGEDTPAVTPDLPLADRVEACRLATEPAPSEEEVPPVEETPAEGETPATEETPTTGEEAPTPDSTSPPTES
jgi:hypothetical protein